ncbi:hypothetical protein LguiB_020586 [Lonicera macranthoides]
MELRGADWRKSPFISPEGGRKSDLLSISWGNHPYQISSKVVNTSSTTIRSPHANRLAALNERLKWLIGIKGVVADSEDFIKSSADALGSHRFINYFSLQQQKNSLVEISKSALIIVSSMAYDDDDDQVDKQQPPQLPLQEEEGRLPGWADLPEELLISIIIVLQGGLNFWEICQCGRVCRRWESVLRDNLAVPVLLCIQHCISLAPPAPRDTLADYGRLITEPEAAYKVDHTPPRKQT